MLSKVSEKRMHAVRLVLVIGWLLLIFSLFYDPITHHLTNPSNFLSPFRDSLPQVIVQGKPLKEQPYPIGARVFWGMVVPSAIMIVLVFGHETWRRICPLYFLSQIPRALGLKPRLNINKNTWLTRNHFYVQFALLFIGLNFRILFINSARLALGLFLLTAIASSITVIFLYGGRSWCHYVCPFGVVQTVFTGPRSLLGSNGISASPQSITQSMCRTVDITTNQEKSACIGCKSACMDIDAEKSYWNDLKKPGRRFVQYGYLGLVIGYFVYYRLYAGNFDYYFSGAWMHEENQLSTLWKPGFYLFNEPINIPKIIAVPLTLAFAVALSYWSLTKIEKAYRAYLKKHNSRINSEQVLHRMLTICTFIAFNSFFIYGGRPEILRLPVPAQLLFNTLVVIVSTMWLVRTWGRSFEQYQRDSNLDSFRRQLSKLSINNSQFLKGRSLDELSSNELFILASVLPEYRQKDRLEIYKSILLEGLIQKNFTSSNSLEILQEIRQKLALSENEHFSILSEISSEQPFLIYPNQRINPANSHVELTQTRLLKTHRR
ncbi:4Fe-4S binding protein [Plectonema cf. radiosum LEGE 06105]|uniref:4Fe-4S binding protein n=1 Tax=Plectonema cf. radiosum LEGE 06105 TaxID=945769 RepID=A0A8J7F9D0_9CYAN|nr:4Fe-4S binding protein [Plectonema radiosum]MBE9214569.1 4Fe-4S binding protein [Plectonema cf. radiosum LEGE 06105]